jgi:hypothetical protein
MLGVSPILLLSVFSTFFNRKTKGREGKMDWMETSIKTLVITSMLYGFERLIRYT